MSFIAMDLIDLQEKEGNVFNLRTVIDFMCDMLSWHLSPHVLKCAAPD